MSIPVKILMSLALAAAGLLSPPAFAVTAGEFATESLVAGLAEFGTLGAAFAVGMASSGWESGQADDENRVGLAVAGTLAVSYPLTTACGAYFMGEGAHTPSANKGKAFGMTVLAAYGQVFAVAGIAGAVYLISDISRTDARDIAIATDLLTKPLFVTYVYNKFKKPAYPRDSRLPSLEAYVAAATGSDGKAVPVYGVTLNF
jgi:hypothetical protein